MDIFANQEGVKLQEVQADTLGNFQIFESGLIPMVIKAAFMDTFKKGSHNITLLLETRDGQKFRHQEYVADKDGNNFYIDKQTGEKCETFGMAKMRDLSEMLTGDRLTNPDIEEKFHNIYDSEQKKEVPQKRKTLMAFKDQLVHVGMLKIISNKQVLVGDKYVDTNEERESNEIDRFFDKSKSTLTEIKAEAAPAFFADWNKANHEKTRNKFKTVAGAPASGAPAAAAADDLDFDS